MLHEDLTGKIIGCAIEVHKRLGKWLSGSNLPTCIKN